MNQVEKNMITAYEWFKKGIALDNATCYYQSLQSDVFIYRFPRDHPTRLDLESLGLDGQNEPVGANVVSVEEIWPGLSRAAALGEPNAQYDLAIRILYVRRIYEWPDSAKNEMWATAKQLLESASELGHIGANINLSFFYLNDR